MNLKYVWHKILRGGLIGVLLCTVLSAQGQCSGGECLFMLSELNSRMTFKYSTSIINDQPKRVFAGGELVDADFSRKNGILRVNLYGLQVDGPASEKKIFIRTKSVWIKSGPEFKKPDDIRLLPMGERATIELKFEAIANSSNSRGQIRVDYTVIIDNNEMVFANNANRPYFIVNYDFKSFKESVDFSPVGKLDPIRDKLASLEIEVTNKKINKTPQWFLPYVEAYEHTSDSKLKNPLEQRLEDCCTELYDASKTRAELEQFIRIYNVENRLNCEAFGRLISKAYKKLEALPSSKNSSLVIEKRETDPTLLNEQNEKKQEKPFLPKSIPSTPNHAKSPFITLTQLKHQRFKIEINRADPPYELWYKAHTEQAYLPEHTFLLREEEPRQRVFELSRAELEGVNSERITISIRKSEGNAAIGEEMELDFRIPPSPYPRWLTQVGWGLAGFFALLVLFGRIIRRWILTNPLLRVLFRIPHNRWK